MRTRLTLLHVPHITNKIRTKTDEINLLNLLDSLNSKGIRFALSNVLESKGKVMIS